MSKLTTQQFRHAVIIGLLLYAALMTALFAWLIFNAETTLQRRIAMTPNVTVALPGFEKLTEDVPASWTAEDGAETAEESAAEETSPPEAKPEAQAEETPAQAAQETPSQEAPLEQSVPDMHAPALPQTPDAIPADTMTAPQEKAEAPMPYAPPKAAMPRWKKYARPFDQQDTRPRIGLIVSDLGLAAAATQSAIQDLPGEVTLAFSSLTNDLDGWIAKARVAGHEAIVTIPMEPENYPQNDPGPNTLLTGLSNDDNVTRIRRALARAEGYVAVMPFMGEKFVTAEDKLAPILDVVNDHGLLIFDSTMHRQSLIAPLSRLGRIPFARTDLLVDAAASRMAIEAQLEALEKRAKERGQAIGIALPYPVTFEKLQAWIATLEQKGIVLAPITALASEEVVVTPAAEQTAPQETPAAPAAKPSEKPAEPDPNRIQNELVQ